MKVTVKKLQGGECVLEVLPTTYIAEIKYQVAEKLNIPVDEQKLLLLGRTLVDDQRVEAYPAIKDGTKLNLVVKKPEGLYEAAVKYFKKMDMTDAEARNTASRLIDVVQEKFNKLSWDDIDRLALDCMLSENGVDAVPMETESEDTRNI